MSITLIADKGIRKFVKSYAKKNSDLREPSVAKDQCYVISRDFVYKARETFRHSDTRFAVVPVGRRQPYRSYCCTREGHYAVVIDDGKSQIRVDFTARQFDKKLPFPLIVWERHSQRN